MLTPQQCPQHACPLIRVGDETVCLLEHARGLLDNPIQDLVVDQNLTVLILPGYVLLPLVGWEGNLRATNEESAAALLEILTDLYLCGVRWNKQQHKLEIFLADQPGARGAGQWSLDLQFKPLAP